MKSIKLILVLLLMAFSLLVNAQTDPKPGEAIDTVTIELDTVAPNVYSTEAIKNILIGLRSVEQQREFIEQPIEQQRAFIDQQKEDLMQKLMLVVSAYIEPKTLYGFTQDNKIYYRRYVKSYPGLGKDYRRKIYI